MPQIVNTNIMSLNSQRALNQSQSDLATSLQRLSTGLRINSARDDAAGLAISERFSAQIRGLTQGVRNASDGISLAQTGEGALQEITTALQRIRELSVQAVNGTNSASDRATLQQEVSELQSEISRVAGTQFNGVAVVGGGAGTNTFQVGANAGDTITITTTNVLSGAGANSVLTTTTAASGTYSRTTSDSSIVGSTGFTDSATNTPTVSTASGASALISAVDTYLDSVNSQRATLGAVQNRFESVVRNGENVVENLTASRSRIMDADFAAETANLTRAQILQQAGVAMLSQANAMPQTALALLQ